jgi:hypothetical protein
MFQGISKAVKDKRKELNLALVEERKGIFRHALNEMAGQQLSLGAESVVNAAMNNVTFVSLDQTVQCYVVCTCWNCFYCSRQIEKEIAQIWLVLSKKAYKLMVGLIELKKQHKNCDMCMCC